MKKISFLSAFSGMNNAQTGKFLCTDVACRVSTDYGRDGARPVFTNRFWAALLLSALLCAGNMNVNAQDDWCIRKGEIGSISWTFDFCVDENVLQVSGSGAIPDNFIEVINLLGSISNIVISEGITHIGKKAFEGAWANKITIPNTVTSIGDSAFWGCVLLGYYDDPLIIPNSVKSIGAGAFQNCYQLKSVTIPSSVTSIGEWAFAGCGNLSSLTLDASITAIEDFTFRNCSTLTTVRIPNSVNYIETGAFLNCNGLTSITFSNNLQTIGERAFGGCYRLTFIDMPNTVTSVGDRAFEGCFGLEMIFYSSSLETIGNSAFQGCTRLKSAILPHSLISIGEHAFSECSGLEWASIPASVTSIGSSAFLFCRNLRNFRVLNPVPITIPSDMISFIYTCLHVPEGAIPAYKAAPQWSRFACLEDYVPVTGLEVVCPPSYPLGLYEIVEFSWKILPENASNKMITISHPSNDITYFPEWDEMKGSLFFYDCYAKDDLTFRTADGNFVKTCPLEVFQPSTNIYVEDRSGTWPIGLNFLNIIRMCVGEPIQLFARSDPFDACPLDYEWLVFSDNDCVTITPQDSRGIGAIFTPEKAGTAVFRVMEKNSGSLSFPFRIEVHQAAIASIENRKFYPSMIEFGKTAKFIAHVENNPFKDSFQYNWELIAGAENGVTLEVDPNPVNRRFATVRAGHECTYYELELTVLGCGPPAVSTIDGLVYCKHGAKNGFRETTITVTQGWRQSIPYKANSCANATFTSYDPEIAEATDSDNETRRSGIISGISPGTTFVRVDFGGPRGAGPGGGLGCIDTTIFITVHVVPPPDIPSPGRFRRTRPEPTPPPPPPPPGTPEADVRVDEITLIDYEFEVDKENPSRRPVWRSLDPCIAEVTPDGLIIARSPGVVEILGTYGDETISVFINVPEIITGIIPIDEELTMEPGDVENLRAIVHPRTDLVWSSDKPDIAYVCPDGGIIGMSPGTATVTVSTPDGLNYAECEVKVGKKPVYVTCFTSEESVSDWTFSNVTWQNHSTTHGSSIRFNGNGAFAQMPELEEGTKDMFVVVTTVYGNYIQLHTSPDGETFTNQGLFTGDYSASSASKPVPDGTRYIRFVSTSYDIFMMLAAVNGDTSVPECEGDILYVNCFSSDESVSDWTLDGVSRINDPTYGNTLRFDEGWATAQMPVLAEGTKGMNIVVTALWGNSISLQTSPDGETFTNHGTFAVGYGVGSASKPVPDGTRYIRFQSQSLGMLLMLVAISDQTDVPKCIISEGITLNKYKLSVDVNEIERLIVIDAPPTVNNNITWSSDNPEVVTVDEFTGEVTAIEPGNAIITVAAIPDLSPEDGVYAQVKVLVIGQENPATDIDFIDCPITIEEGELLDITEHLQLLPADASMPDFTIEDEDILTIDNGVLFGISAGVTTITATSRHGASNTCIVTVTATILFPVTGVSLNKNATSLAVGNDETLFATVAPANATVKKVTWTSDNPDVATVIDGTVTAVSEGTATITATTEDGDFKAQCVVTVTAAENIPVTGVSLNKTTTSLLIGADETLTATITPADATNKYVTWTTNTPSVATVVNGTVTAVSEGTATITVTTVDGDFTAQCVVTVSATVEPDPDPDEIYDNDISSSTSVNDWTLSGVTWNSANSGQLVFETEGSFAVMPVLPCAKDMEVTITARYGDYIYLHVSPDGETYTSLGLFTGHSGIVTASKTIPDNTHYIRFVAAPYTYSDVYLISVTITGVEDECDDDDDIVNAQTPVITAHPQGAEYDRNASATPLTIITAPITDGGTLAYEWFRNTTNSNNGGTSVSTSTTYAPSTANLGTLYYYVVVTNTNNAVNGVKTAISTSNTAAVTVNDPSTNVAELFMPDLKIYPNPFTGEVRIVGAVAVVETGRAPSLQMQIINSTGALVHTQMIENADEVIALEHLPAGVYLFIFEKDGNVRSERVVKE